MLIISAKFGRLGNRLWLFANFMAFALEYNQQILNPAFDEYFSYFEGSNRDFLCSYPPLKCTFRGTKELRLRYYQFIKKLEENQYFFRFEVQRNKPFQLSDSEVLEKIKYYPVVFFGGWLMRDGWYMEDIHLLQKYASQIRAYFSPLQSHQSTVNTLMNEVRKEADVVIGVHIRQGDYQEHQGGRYFFVDEQYIQVMKKVKTLFPNRRLKFLICSNTNHEPKLFQEFNCTFGIGQIIEDLYSFAQCDYIVGPPSTFTMWASFYGEKPLYMIRDIQREIVLEDFVPFYDWKGVFHPNEDWSKTFWEWTH
ncbi:MAG: alpha-1,2-fucosyltransferase [Leptolyngbyaceae cyanobacterium bins.59]|nr:alpha-1,2-fucosyltransferase [Leptolyngbyaceae cyanobacterium bins.59]